MSSNDRSEFQIKDSRLFNPDGSLREETPSQPESQPKSEPQKASATTSEKKNEPKADSTGYQRSPESIDFPTFVLSLASSAQISMGIVPNPMTGRVDRDLMHAKQTIDIIGMLEEKTQGNLSPEESGLIRQVLFQLRMQFVEINKSQK